MKLFSIILLCLIGANIISGPAYPLKVAAGQRYLVDQNGTPFFMVGDAPQLLMLQVSTNDVETYLADRAARGFNTLWVYPVDSYDQTGAPTNYYGYPPFDGADFTNENTNYWAFVDYVLGRIQSYGMVAVLDPCFCGVDPSYGYLGNVVYSSDTTMLAYGAFLGARYKNYTNVIWSLGGDADPGIPNLYPHLQDIAVSIQSNAPNQLITIEASRFVFGGADAPGNGYSSIDACLLALTNVPSWLSLNWVYKPYNVVQSGASSEYWRSNALPALMGEDWYEGEHDMTPLQLREESYWECLSGCNLGRIFGNNAIWSMGGPGDKMGQTWQSQLGSPGSVAESLLGRLFESREFWLLVPDLSNTVMTAGYQSDITLAVDARTSDGKTVIAYIPTQRAVTFDLTKISGDHANAWWFNPCKGTTTAIGTYDTSAQHTFTPPDTNDWVLVLDDSSQNYPPPGISNVPGTNTLSIVPTTGGQFQLTVGGAPNQIYTLQSTTNLQSPWQTIGSGTTDYSGTFSVPVSATSCASFYRSSH